MEGVEGEGEEGRRGLGGGRRKGVGGGGRKGRVQPTEASLPILSIPHTAHTQSEYAICRILSYQSRNKRRNQGRSRRVKGDANHQQKLENE